MEKKRILGNLYIRNRKKIDNKNSTQSEKNTPTNMYDICMTYVRHITYSCLRIEFGYTFITLLPRGVINLFTTRTFGHSINTIHTITEPRAAP